MTPEKRDRIKKLKIKMANAERLYNRSMRMAANYSAKIRKMERLLYKLEYT